MTKSGATEAAMSGRARSIVSMPLSVLSDGAYVMIIFFYVGKLTLLLNVRVERSSGMSSTPLGMNSTVFAEMP
jgi:hypothetical protein